MMPRLNKQLVDTRAAFSRCGIDYGADARVLLVKGLFRLVWANATKTLIGIRGGGHTSRPCTLELREFHLDGEHLLPRGSETLLSGGRLSRARLLSTADRIDAVFGAGVAAQLDHRQTTLLGTDEVGAWMAERAKREERSQQENALAWKKRMAELPDTTFDGIKL